MSDKLREFLCGILDEAEKIAKSTQSPIDDFIVGALQRMLHCK